MAGDVKAPQAEGGGQCQNRCGRLNRVRWLFYSLYLFSYAFANSSLCNNLDSIRTRVYDMFVKVHDWTYFSNHTASSGANGDSLESVHDTMHVYVTLAVS